MLHPLDSANKVFLLRNKFLNLIEGVESIADLLDYAWAHFERLRQVGHHVKVVGSIRHHVNLRGCWDKVLLTLKQPVLATSVKPADVGDPATHLAYVVAVKSIHGDVSALSATGYKAVSYGLRPARKFGRRRWSRRSRNDL